MTDRPEAGALPVSPLFGLSFGLTTILFSLLDWRSGAGATAGLALAASAGVVAGLNQRWIAGLIAFGLILRAIELGAAGLRPTDIAPVLLLLLGAAALRPVPGFALPAWAWALLPVSTAALLMAAQYAPTGGAAWTALLIASGALASFAGFAAARHFVSANLPEAVRYALGDRRWLMETSRFLLLGRISSGMSHELSQALNVITMANGNLGYILGRAEIGEPHGKQLTERVRRIAANAESAAQMLGQFRWFGQDGGREGGELTVGSALEQAVAATRAAARKSGVGVEIRGDALTHSLPLRHGTIEMMTTVALLEIIQMLSGRPTDGPPPDPIILEATKTQSNIIISMLCASADGSRAPDDDIAQATYELLTKLAVTCHCDLRRVNRRNNPVRFTLRMDRDVA